MRRTIFLIPIVLFALSAPTASAADRLCDPSFENCRDPLIQLIRNETSGIDVAFWFMEDARYTTELIRRWQAGVPVRVLVDTRANASTPANADRLGELANAGIPMRRRTAGGILHWKAMIFDAQRTVQFSAANYSDEAFVPFTPYVNYIDEVIYFTDDPALVDTFMTKYDDLWTNTSSYTNYANVTSLQRYHPTTALHSSMNFPPAQNYASRAVGRYNAETQKIDVIMYRVTDRRHSDAMIAAVGRGIPVRLITEPHQYRDPIRLWHSWNIDRMYMAGVQIRHRKHLGTLHQKSVLLYSQGMTIFGSSNWTSPSAESQEEHNYFTTKPAFFEYFRQQFERKWNNDTGNEETEPFVPLPPDRPSYLSPANGASGLSTAVTLVWDAGLWAHKYDILLGTSPTSLNPIASNVELGPSQSSRDLKQYTLSNLNAGTTYYWGVVSKTMADQPNPGPVWSFTTGGTPAPPPVNGTLGPGDILLYAGSGSASGDWQTIGDGTGAGGVRMWNPDRGRAKVSPALASPADYFELTFNALAGVGYRLWLRGRAENNHHGNDSAHVQFSGSVNSAGSPAYRIGTTSSAEVVIEDCGGCGVRDWGWQDNGYGVNTLGPLIYFESSGTQTIRVQRREDGMSIDQIMLSPQKFLTTAPGALKDDATIYPATDGGGGPPPPPPPPTNPDVVLYASRAVAVGNWVVEPDSSAAGGLLVRNPDRGAAKIKPALSSPSDYLELTFTAQAGVPYHLWIRGRALNDDWASDSVHVQFSGSVDSAGTPVFRIGTSASAEWNLEDCGGCGISGWGWQDNGWGVNVLGPHIYFETSGTQTIRIQVREDGVLLDQIILSPQRFLTTPPGLLKNDTNIYAESGGGT
ncbi:MAG TPA: phosphatidylserine/phosphatidylglycerophosphate/cardiolipin synthase family protein [Vicinamibacterales bacterium]|nr:phosphatidylserine/phosphatidylglycerophosphate/cardiolipin synthase family protein [Vicinamibacterales bacterium]